MVLKKNKYELPLVEVVWLDAETTHGWEGTEETDMNEVPVTTIGFLVAHNHSCIVIASSIATSVNNSRIKIPIGMVSSIQEISVTKKKAATLKDDPPESIAAPSND